MKREAALQAIVAHTAKDDEAGALRIYVENRISYSAFREAVRKGRAWKAKAQKEHA